VSSELTTTSSKEPQIENPKMKLLTTSLSILAVGGILAGANAASRWMCQQFTNLLRTFRISSLHPASGYLTPIGVDAGQAEGAATG